MIEGSIGCIITLNYDKALTVAFAELHAKGIGQITGSETVEELGTKCVIYLHGNADCDAEDWILRRSDLDEAWENTWKDLVAGRLASTRCLVFAGLGSPAAILTESVARVRQIDPGAPSVYLVDPSDTSPFAAALDLPESDMMQMSWCQFMARLAERVVEECCKEIRSAAPGVSTDHGWAIEDGRFDDLVDSLQEAGLRRLGMIRAIWLGRSDPGHSNPYYPDSELTREPMALLLLALGEVLADMRHELSTMSDGRIRVTTVNSIPRSIIGFHGAGVRPWALARHSLQKVIANMSDPPDVVLATGFTGPPIEDLAPPDSIVHGLDDDNVVTADDKPRLFDIDAIKGSGRKFAELVA